MTERKLAADVVLVAAFVWAVLLLMFLLSGCAALQKERQKYLEPEQLPAYKSHFQSEYSAAAKKAQDEPTPANIATYIDAGSALLATSCHQWLHINTLASRGLIVDSETLSLLNGAMTTLAGIAGATPAFVGTLGVAQVAASGMNANLQNNILGVPAQYAVQTAILDKQADCVEKLTTSQPKTFSSAYRGLLMCERVCSWGAAGDLTTKSLQGASK